MLDGENRIDAGRTQLGFTRRNFVILMALVGATATSSMVLGGCSSSGSEQTPSSSTESNVVYDANGDAFTIPDTVKRIVITCNGGTTHEVAIFGGADMIKAQPSMKKFSQLLKMYPQFKDVVDGGSFDDVNVETLAAQDPDVALVGVSSAKGNAQIADLGIPTYVMLIGWAAIDTLQQEFLNVGKIVGNEQKAEDLCSHWQTVMAKIDERASKIPASARKTVYYLSSANITKANTGDWGLTWIDRIGADCAVPEADLSGSITVEKALGWNPDVIVVQGGNDLSGLTSDEQVREMKAIKENQVYSCPIGGFWWDRPSPEATLGFLWLAQTVYPEYYSDIDLKTETKAFFEEFYKYSLTDEEYKSFF